MDNAKNLSTGLKNELGELAKKHPLSKQLTDDLSELANKYPLKKKELSDPTVVGSPETIGQVTPSGSESLSPDGTLSLQNRSVNTEPSLSPPVPLKETPLQADVAAPVQPGATTEKDGGVTPYLQGFAKSFNRSLSDILRTADFAVNKLESTIGTTLFGKEFEPARKAMTQAGIGGSPFAGAADLVDKANEGALNAPDNIGGAVVEGVGAILPDIIGASLMPEVKVGGWLAKHGVTGVDKFAMYLAGKEGTQAAAASEGGTPGQQVMAPLEGAAHGFTTGLLFNSFGKVSSKIGENVATKLVGNPATYKEALNKALVQGTAGTLSNALMFGGYSGLEEYLQTGEVSAKNVGTNFGIGLALGAKDLGKMAFVRGLQSFVAAPREQINKTYQSPSSPEQMKAMSDENLAELNSAVEGLDKNKTAAEAAVTDNAANLKAFTEQVVQNPEEVKQAVAESDLPESAKAELNQKIDQTAFDNDPRTIATAPVVEEIAKLEEQAKSLDNIEAAPEQKVARQRPIRQKIAELKKQVEEVYNQPVEQPTAPTEVPERATGQNVTPSAPENLAPEPITQLGSGANVYYETPKLRVNETSDGKVILNINDNTDATFPIANIKFDNATEAVNIAERINKLYPDGVPPAVLIDKVVADMRKDPNYPYPSSQPAPDQGDMNSNEPARADVGGERVTTEPVVNRNTYENTDTRGKYFAIIKDGKIVTSGSNPSLGENPMPIKNLLDLAKKYDGKLFISDKPIVSTEMNTGDIMGYTFEQIQSAQQGKGFDVTTKFKINEGVDKVEIPQYEDYITQSEGAGSDNVTPPTPESEAAGTAKKEVEKFRSTLTPYGKDQYKTEWGYLIDRGKVGTKRSDGKFYLLKNTSNNLRGTEVTESIYNHVEDKLKEIRNREKESNKPKTKLESYVDEVRKFWADPNTIAKVAKFDPNNTEWTKPLRDIIDRAEKDGITQEELGKASQPPSEGKVSEQVKPPTPLTNEKTKEEGQGLLSPKGAEPTGEVLPQADQPGAEAPGVAPAKEDITAKHNRLFDAVSSYNKSNKNTRKKIGQGRITKLAADLGYSVGNGFDGKIEVKKDGKLIRKIPIQQKKESVESHKAVKDYNDGFQAFVEAATNGFESLTGIDLGMTTAETNRAIRDIREGKKSAPANRVLDRLEGMYEQHDGLNVITGTGNGAERKFVSTEELLREYEANKMETTPEVESLKDQLSPELSDLIKKEGINIDNIDQFKDNSFIFDDGEFELVKKYLENENQNRQQGVRSEVSADAQTQGEAVGILEQERTARIAAIDAELTALEQQRKAELIRAEKANSNVELPLDVPKDNELFSVDQNFAEAATAPIDKRINDLKSERAVLESKAQQVAEADRAQTTLLPTVTQLQEELAQGKWAGRMTEYGKAMEEARKQVKPSDKAKTIANKIRSNKVDPGIDTTITLGFKDAKLWNDLLDFIADGVEAGGRMADVIQKGIDYLKGTDFYKNLTKQQQGEHIDEFISAMRKIDPSETAQIKERKFFRSVQNAENISQETKDLLKTDPENRFYVVKKNALSVEQAKNYVDEVGLDQTIKDLSNPDVEMQPSNRNFIALEAMRQADAKGTELKAAGDMQGSDEYYEKATQVAEDLIARGTELGKAVQSLATLGAPERVVYNVRKAVKQKRAENKEKSKGDIDNKKSTTKKSVTEAVDETLNDPNIKNKIKRAKRKPIDPAESLAKRIIGRLGDAKKKFDPVREMVNVLFGKVDETLEPKKRTKETAIEKLKRVLSNKDEYAKTWEQAKIEVQKIMEEKGFPPEMIEEYNRQLEAFQNEVIGRPYNEGMTDAATREAINSEQVNLDELIRKHYTVYDATKRKLVDKLIEDAGVDGEDARLLAEAVEKSFDRAARRRIQGVIDRMLNRGTKSASKKKSSTEELIDMVNMGAFSDEQFLNWYADTHNWVKLTPEKISELHDLADKVHKAKDGFQKYRATEDLMKFQRKMEGVTWAEVGQAYWYANVLSGVPTHLVNFVANVLNSTQLLANAALSNPKQIPAMLMGFAKGIEKGWYNAGDVLKTGYAPVKAGKLDFPNTLEIKDPFKGGNNNPMNWAKFVTRAMMASDMLSYSANKEMREYQLARMQAKKDGIKSPSLADIQDRLFNTKQRIEDAQAQAKSEGLKGRDFHRRVFELVEQSRPVEMVDDAATFASRATFNYAPEGTLGVLTDAINNFTNKVDIAGFKPAKLLIPFTNIISNVANNAIDYTPYGLVRAVKGGMGWKNMPKGKWREFTPEQRKDALIKVASGTVAMAAMYMLTEPDDKGNSPIEITASGTGDFKKNYELKQTGWKEYSIRIGDHWYSYQYSPLALALAPIGFLRDRQKYRKETIEDPGVAAVFANAMYSTVRMMLDMTAVSSLNSVVEALSSDNPETGIDRLKSSAATIGKSFVVPNLYTQAKKQYDEMFDIPAKDASTVIEKLYKDVPVARNKMFDKINALGDPVVLQTDRLETSVKHDPVWEFIVKHNAYIGTPRKESIVIEYPKPRQITDEEYYQFLKLRGTIIKTGVQQIMEKANQNPTLWTSERIRDKVTDLKTKASKIAKVKVFATPTP